MAPHQAAHLTPAGTATNADVLGVQSVNGASGAGVHAAPAQLGVCLELAIRQGNVGGFAHRAEESGVRIVAAAGLHSKRADGEILYVRSFQNEATSHRCGFAGGRVIGDVFEYQSAHLRGYHIDPRLTALRCSVIQIVKADFTCARAYQSPDLQIIEFRGGTLEVHFPGDTEILTGPSVTGLHQVVPCGNIRHVPVGRMTEAHLYLQGVRYPVAGIRNGGIVEILALDENLINILRCHRNVAGILLSCALGQLNRCQFFRGVGYIEAIQLHLQLFIVVERLHLLAGKSGMVQNQAAGVFSRRSDGILCLAQLQCRLTGCTGDGDVLLSVQLIAVAVHRLGHTLPLQRLIAEASAEAHDVHPCGARRQLLTAQQARCITLSTLFDAGNDLSFMGEHICLCPVAGLVARAAVDVLGGDRRNVTHRQTLCHRPRHRAGQAAHAAIAGDNVHVCPAVLGAGSTTRPVDAGDTSHKTRGRGDGSGGIAVLHGQHRLVGEAHNATDTGGSVILGDVDINVPHVAVADADTTGLRHQTTADKVVCGGIIGQGAVCGGAVADDTHFRDVAQHYGKVAATCQRTVAEMQILQSSAAVGYKGGASGEHRRARRDLHPIDNQILHGSFSSHREDHPRSPHIEQRDAPDGVHITVNVARKGGFPPGGSIVSVAVNTNGSG